MLRNWDDLKTELKLIHEDKYDYSQTIYIGMSIHFYIQCPVHGNFKILPSNHYNNKGGCPECAKIKFGKRAKEKNTYTNEALVKKFQEIYGNLYDYSKVDHSHINNEIKIICKKHGEFLQSARNHLVGKGCYKCGRISASKKATLTNDEAINNFKSIHGNRYNYSKVEYINNRIKVQIICKIHGSFWQTPNSHQDGKGCTECSLSKGEAQVAKFLDDHEFDYILEYPVLNELSGKYLRYDFYVPEINCFIEYDGEQHFKPVNLGGMSDEQALKVHEGVVKRDKIKNKIAEEQKIDIIRIRFDEDVSDVLNKHLNQSSQK